MELAEATQCAILAAAAQVLAHRAATIEDAISMLFNRLLSTLADYKGYVVFPQVAAPMARSKVKH